MYFTLECQKKAFQFIVDVYTAYEMYQNLVDKYEPEEEDDYLELSTQFMRCKMKSETDDPETWFHEIDYICQRMKKIMWNMQNKRWI